MTIQFNDETFYGDFTFKNSDWAVKRFPFPFHEDSYMYSVNMEPHKSYRPGSVFERTFDVDEHYVSEMRDRARVLANDPLRCQSLPHMTLAGWDLLRCVEDRVALDDFASRSIWFDPRNDKQTRSVRGWDWTRDETLVRRPTRRDIPVVLTRPSLADPAQAATSANIDVQSTS